MFDATHPSDDDMPALLDRPDELEGPASMMYTFAANLSPDALSISPTSTVTEHTLHRRATVATSAPTYIPRPPNAFILFRSSFVRAQCIPGAIEANHSTLSKIAGMYWRSLPPREKEVWERRARAALAEHRRKYPDWRFRNAGNNAGRMAGNHFGRLAKVKDGGGGQAGHGQLRHGREQDGTSNPRSASPTSEMGPKDSRRPSRNRPSTKRERGESTMERCAKIAGFLGEGKIGDELLKAVEEYDRQARSPVTPAALSTAPGIDDLDPKSGSTTPRSCDKDSKGPKQDGPVGIEQRPSPGSDGLSEPHQQEARSSAPPSPPQTISPAKLSLSHQEMQSLVIKPKPNTPPSAPLPSHRKTPSNHILLGSQLQVPNFTFPSDAVSSHSSFSSALQHQSWGNRSVPVLEISADGLDGVTHAGLGSIVGGATDANIAGSNHDRSLDSMGEQSSSTPRPQSPANSHKTGGGGGGAGGNGNGNGSSHTSNNGSGEGGKAPDGTNSATTVLRGELPDWALLAAGEADVEGERYDDEFMRAGGFMPPGAGVGAIDPTFENMDMDMLSSSNSCGNSGGNQLGGMMNIPSMSMSFPFTSSPVASSSSRSFGNDSFGGSNASSGTSNQQQAFMQIPNGNASLNMHSGSGGTGTFPTHFRDAMRVAQMYRFGSGLGPLPNAPSPSGAAAVQQQVHRQHIQQQQQIFASMHYHHSQLQTQHHPPQQQHDRGFPFSLPQDSMAGWVPPGVANHQHSNATTPSASSRPALNHSSTDYFTPGHRQSHSGNILGLHGSNSRSQHHSVGGHSHLGHQGRSISLSSVPMFLSQGDANVHLDDFNMGHHFSSLPPHHQHSHSASPGPLGLGSSSNMGLGDNLGPPPTMFGYDFEMEGPAASSTTSSGSNSNSATPVSAGGGNGFGIY